jgi:hypothetical protein
MVREAKVLWMNSLSTDTPPQDLVSIAALATLFVDARVLVCQALWTHMVSYVERTDTCEVPVHVGRRVESFWVMLV